jgi:hypothetical protein
VLGWIFPFLFGQKGAPRDVEGTKYDIKEHQKCQEIYKKCWGNYGWKYFIFYIISHKGVLRTIGKHGSRKEDVGGDIGKAQFYFAFKATRGTQKKKKKTLRMDIFDHWFSSVVIKLLFFKIV